MSRGCQLWPLVSTLKPAVSSTDSTYCNAPSATCQQWSASVSPSKEVTPDIWKDELRCCHYSIGFRSLSSASRPDLILIDRNSEGHFHVRCHHRTSLSAKTLLRQDMVPRMTSHMYAARQNHLLGVLLHSCVCSIHQELSLTPPDISNHTRPAQARKPTHRAPPCQEMPHQTDVPRQHPAGTQSLLGTATPVALTTRAAPRAPLVRLGLLMPPGRPAVSIAAQSVAYLLLRRGGARTALLARSQESLPT